MICRILTQKTADFGHSLRQNLRKSCAILIRVMAMTVYLDVLLLSNFWVDLMLLRTEAYLLHRPLKAVRGGISAGIGAGMSLMLLLPPMPVWCSFGIRVFGAFCMTAAAFGLGSVRDALRLTGVLLGMSVGFCGAVYALSAVYTPIGFCVQNTYIYADLSLLTLLGGITAASAVSTLISHRRARIPHSGYRLHLRIQGQDFSIPALADTGNLLRDAYTGKPVVICGTAQLAKWVAAYPDAESAAASCTGFRLLPVQTVTGTRLLPVFQPDCAAVSDPRASREAPLDVMIAISDTAGAGALIPSCCIR